MRANWFPICVILAASAATAHADIGLRLYLRNQQDDFHFTSPTSTWSMSIVPGISLPDPTNPANFYTYTLTFPDGHVASSGKKIGAVVLIGEEFSSYASFPDLRTAAEAGPWTLTVAFPGDPSQGIDPTTSVYALDLTVDIPGDLMVQTQPIVPVPGQNLPASPTFSWPAGLNYSSGYAMILSPTGSLATSPQLDPTVTSWTPSITLPGGTYGFFLGLTGPDFNYPLPVTATLLSGPDLGTVALHSEYDFSSVTTFHVPEPAALSLAPLALLAFRRKRAQPNR